MLKPCDFKARKAMVKKLESLSHEFRTVVDSCGFTQREIATRLGSKSMTTIRRLLNGRAHKATIETLAWVAWACGYELRWEFVSRHVEEPAHGMEDGI